MTHDSEANAAYIYLVEQIAFGEVARTAVADIELTNASINVDFDSAGRVLGIEILGADQILRDQTIQSAEDITGGS